MDAPNKFSIYTQQNIHIQETHTKEALAHATIDGWTNSGQENFERINAKTNNTPRYIKINPNMTQHI